VARRSLEELEPEAAELELEDARCKSVNERRKGRRRNSREGVKSGAYAV
jgi:hypothetical protein